MSTTTPARHLHAIGYDVSDSPVQTAGGSAIAHNAWAHTIANAPRVRLSVEHSMPTLLRALARQHGAKLKPGEVPTWTTNHKGRWWLRWGYPADEGLGPVTWRSFGLADGLRCDVVPALTAGMDRLEALAAVIAWLVKARGLTP